MPTLADILAKKRENQLIATDTKPKAADTALRKTTGDASSTLPGGAGREGLRITPESTKAAKSAEVKAFLDASAPKAPPPAPRELGAATRGEQIPMDHPPQDAPEADKQWFSACHSFDSEMCVVIEPGETSEHAWIACRPNPHRPPILLHRLPLVGRPTEANPY